MHTSPIARPHPSAPSEPDSTLMARVRADDEGAMQAIMQRHWQPLVRYAERFERALDAAEDIVQETFVRLWERRKSLSSDAAVRPMLYRIVRNIALGHARHLAVERRTQADVQDAITPKQVSPYESAVDDEMRSALFRALNLLPPRRREALVLVRLQGLSLAEAAERMKLSRQTVANHISLALDDLEVVLKDFSSHTRPDRPS